MLFNNILFETVIHDIVPMLTAILRRVQMCPRLPLAQPFSPQYGPIYSQITA
jgi:hypothetical protein